jgi:hypothetical protein
LTVPGVPEISGTEQGEDVQAGSASGGEAQPAAAASRRAFPAALAAIAAVFAASFANFLTYHGYPPLRPEIGLVALGLAAGAGAAAFLDALLGRVRRAAVEALLGLVAIDLNADLGWLALLAGAGAFALSYAKRISVLPFVAILAAVVLLTTLAGLGQRRPALEKIAGRPATPAAGPAILHLILDEHIGLEGITSPAVRAEVARFYAERGFRLFGRAYSRHFHTVNAIPDILNFGGSGPSERSRIHLRAGRTAYLGLLARRGYPIHVHESDFADFCSDVAYASCTRYWSPSLQFVADLPFGPAEKARLIAYKFAGLSNLAVWTARFYSGLADGFGEEPRGPPRLRLERWARSSSVSGLAAFDALAADLRQARRGEAYFAHLLVPHYPYVAAPDCRVLPPSRWDYRRSETPIAAREAAYDRQLRCVLGKLDRALAALAESPAGADAVVIVHGDHGSRISDVEPLASQAGRLSDRDLVAGFSTLFAIRASGVTGGIEARPVPVPDLLEAVARSHFTSTEPVRRAVGPRMVVLDDNDWRPRRQVALPDAWQDAAR